MRPKNKMMLAAFVGLLFAAARISAKSYNILEYGAVSDNETTGVAFRNADAIMTAFNAAELDM